jgi:spore coat protein U-like protein
MQAKYLLYISGMALAVLMAVPREAIGACSFNSTVGVSFGAYRFFDATPTDSTGSITYTCLLQFSPITIHLSKGSAPTYVPRQMRQGTDTLDYNLYLDASRVSIWGDGTGGSSRYGPISPPLLGAPVTVTIYGRIPASQNVRIGSYTDTVTVTINF